jgi:uncharacterized protein (DUF2141 family)
MMKFLAIAAASAGLLAATPAFAGDVTVTVQNVQPGSGQVWAVLQAPGDFLKAAGTYKTKVDATAETVQVVFRNVKPGSYVAAVVQDTDRDGKIALGAKGPTEAWGISGAAQKGKPKWMPAMLRVGASGATTSVTLKAPK